MKPKILSLFALCAFTITGFAIAQQGYQAAPVKVPTLEPQFDPDVHDVVQLDFPEVSTQHQRTLEMVREAIEKSDRLGPRKKRVLQRRLNRETVAVRVTDAVTANGMAAGLISVSYDVGTQSVETMVDWDGLIGFIERLIPLIIKLIGLFG